MASNSPPSQHRKATGLNLTVPLGLLALSGRVSPDVAEDERLRLALGQDIAVQRRETVFEVNYTVRLANWLHITPGVQEIVHPVADPARRDATVLDLKTVLNF